MRLHMYWSTVCKGHSLESITFKRASSVISMLNKRLIWPLNSCSLSVGQSRITFDRLTRIESDGVAGRDARVCLFTKCLSNYSMARLLLCCCCCVWLFDRVGTTSYKYLLRTASSLFAAHQVSIYATEFLECPPCVLCSKWRQIAGESKKYHVFHQMNYENILLFSHPTPQYEFVFRTFPEMWF